MLIEVKEKIFIDILTQILANGIFNNFRELSSLLVHFLLGSLFLYSLYILCPGASGDCEIYV